MKYCHHCIVLMKAVNKLLLLHTFIVRDREHKVFKLLDQGHTEILEEVSAILYVLTLFCFLILVLVGSLLANNHSILGQIPFSCQK